MFLRKRSFLEKYDKILYLPIELYSREFNSKLYFAFKAIQKGWTVVIGPEYDINNLAQQLPRGVYFGTGFHKKMSKIFKKLKKIGHIIISQDEEGLDRLPPEFYTKYRIDKKINNFLDYFLCWGKKDEEIIKSAFKTKINTSVVGSLRIDLLHSNLRKIFFKKINYDHHDFVLINGSFGAVNHINGNDYYLNELKTRGWMDNLNDREFHNQRIEYKKKIFEKNIELATYLAKSGQKVVIRPHPSENMDIWKKRTENYRNNIDVIRSGNLTSWMMASKIIIHSGSTSAIEGFLLGKKVISYRPYINEKFETGLPHSISICFKNKHEIINYIKNFKTNIIEKKQDLNILNKNLELSRYDEDASNRILNIIENLKIKNKINQFNLIKKNFLIEALLFKSMIGNKIYKKNFLYRYKKCSNLNLDKTKEFLNLLFESQKKKNKTKVFHLTNYSLVISKNSN